MEFCHPYNNTIVKKIHFVNVTKSSQLLYELTIDFLGPIALHPVV